MDGGELLRIGDIEVIYVNPVLNNTHVEKVVAVIMVVLLLYMTDLPGGHHSISRLSLMTGGYEHM